MAAAMKALRRSMKGDKPDGGRHQHHISISQKDPIAIVPPKKVIKALYDYEANVDHKYELSFSKGDFFHVIGRENDQDWYEACNPSMPNARGLVPVQFFQVLGRTERDSAGSVASATSNRTPDNDSGYSDRSGNSATAERSVNTTPSSNGTGILTPASSNGTTVVASAPSSAAGPDVQQKPMRLSKAMGGKGSGAMVYGMVLYDFTAVRPDELEAKQGEAIIVIAQSTPEWFVAKPIGRLGGPGLIPVSFIEIRDMSTGQAVPDAHAAVQRAGVPKVEEWKRMAADYKNSSISLGRFETQQSSQGLDRDMGRMSMQDTGQHQQNGYSNGASTGHQRTGSRAQHPAQAASNAPHLMQNGQHPSQQQQQQQQQLYRQSSQPAAPISAHIPRFCYANDKYWYVIEAVMEDGRHWELSRYYQDFYDFQIALLAQFPEEAGNFGKPRTLPFMPGPVTYVTDAISNGRRQNLDEYIKKLLTMPEYISKCQLMRALFAPRENDFEIDPNASHDDYRLSAASQRSSNDSPMDNSLHSSQRDLNGQLSAPPRSNHPRGDPSMSNGMTPPGHYRTGSEMQNPATLREASSNLTQESGGSQGGGAGAPNSTGAMKIKVYFQDDLIAIRVPTDIRFEALKEKLLDRLHIDGDIMIQYKDELSNSYLELISNNDLTQAKERNSKLTLFVNPS